MKYLIAIYRTKTGYSASSPDVDGCVATGRTIEETTKNIKVALRFHLESMKNDKEEIPKPRNIVDNLQEYANANYFMFFDSSEKKGSYD